MLFGFPFPFPPTSPICAVVTGSLRSAIRTEPKRNAYQLPQTRYGLGFK
ncbi:predicted protein [Histoplasma capsulatum var. duboisii H88]|uniref:Predicted protein n=1 Tax=Ajellomyces capsulatus (strain H88) TaxID=544711 RepID=F0U542_AJEC8|nr:predicted protein [Histoplasma capsulatum var. duboisii H88]